jgi:hypothetical protein
MKKPLLITVLLFMFSGFDLFAQISPEPRPGFLAGSPQEQSTGSGLLFYLSGNNGFSADAANSGNYLPNYLKDVKIIPGGAIGKGFQAEDDQLMTYWAPGNIFAQRGTLSFFWRSRYPAGKTPFPVFRVAYADHSSWDMVWLRIDYNGAGFDAFVTDIGLARTRVSYFMDKIPAPGEWIHLALSWDETEGIKFYVNGRIAGVQSASGTVFDTGLDQFGPHSRIISPYQVQSAYNFMRGGDIDELRIYDRMLTDDMISGLASGKAPLKFSPFVRDLSQRKWRDEWWLQNGWNLPNDAPPVLPSIETKIRKVEIHEAYDINRWYWKANDGIRETTWPGVYNMSRLPGRYDYFVLPDWDCYSGSGQSVKFTMPGEEWNHIEIWGKAWGQLTLESEREPDLTFAVRSRSQIKSVHALNMKVSGGKIRFDNALIEEPIGSFDVYNVSGGIAPAGYDSETFILYPAPSVIKDSSLIDIASFINGRYPPDERTMMVASGKKMASNSASAVQASTSWPFIHVLIPYSVKNDAGLDGIEIKLPSMKVKPTHNGFYPMNIRIKDPLWPMRDLADFSFSIKPGDAPVLWFDTRDRVLPAMHALYITIAGSGSDLTSDLLKGSEIKLVYKSRESARTEHESDRFTQVRDLYAHVVEEHPGSSRLNLYNRLVADCNDLLSVNPGHWLGQTYRYAATGKMKPEFRLAECPADVPEWAFRQAEYLRYLDRLVSYYIDKRQIASGEFGGGLSDDGDLTNMWPGIAMLGIRPEKILESLKLHIKAYYDQDRPAYYASLRQRSLPLFTNGVASIITDELHALEDGIQVNAQLELLDYGNPLYLEKGMETASKMINDITGVNNAGHRHFRSRLYGGTRVTTDDPWQWSVNRSYLVLHSSYLLARYNGNPEVRKAIVELADGLLAHYRNGNLYTDINFLTDEDREDTGMSPNAKPWSLLYAAFRMTGDKKYLKPLPPVNTLNGVFDEENITKRYRDEITNLAINEYINTQGSVWIDRVSSFNPVIQQDRLGGVALTRTSVLYPQNFVSWKFISPGKFDDVAFFLPSPSDSAIKIIAYNLSAKPVKASMAVWDVVPGKWDIRTGIGINADKLIVNNLTTSEIILERGSEIPLTFESGSYTIVELKLKNATGTDYSMLPDLAIDQSDVTKNENTLTIKVHNIGSAASEPTTLVLKDLSGKTLAAGNIPAIGAPADLKPRWEKITLQIPPGSDLTGGSLIINPELSFPEITRINSTIQWKNLTK